MAKRTEGVTERLLECAKIEFLEKGYENASLRSIAEKADSSKGAIYIRHPNKASLFEALVKPAADGILKLTRTLFEDFTRLTGEQQKQELSEYSNKGFTVFVDYIYDHFDSFTLLIKSSSNEVYTNFIHELVDIEVMYTYKYIESIGSNAVRSGRLTEDFVHLVSQSFFTGVFEVVFHNMSKKDAIEHVDRLRAFYSKGWEAIFYG